MRGGGGRSWLGIMGHVGEVRNCIHCVAMTLWVCLKVWLMNIHTGLPSLAYYIAFGEVETSRGSVACVRNVVNCIHSIAMVRGGGGIVSS